MVSLRKIALAAAVATLVVGDALAQAYEPAVYITELTDESRGRTMEVWVWGPGERRGDTSLVGGNAVFEPVAGRLGHEFAPGRHPLLVFFHGTNGNTRSIAWLSAALAARGYLVVSANHPGSTSLDVTEESILKTWLQATDGSFLIDSLLVSDRFGPSIDATRIGSIGFSLGGYSALAIAGARLQIGRLQDFCRAAPEEATCELFPNALYGPAVKGEPQNRDVSDPRIRAAVSLAPGYVPAMDPASLAAIEVPVLVIAGSADEMLPAAHHARRLAGRLERGEYAELSYASHFSFLGLCAEGSRELLREEGVEFLCDDLGAEQREAVHARVVGYVDSFLGHWLGMPRRH